MKTIPPAIALVLSLAAAPAVAQTDAIGAGVAELPIFDAHMHYKQPAWERYPVATVIELMDRNGVAVAAVSSTPDDGTIRLRDYAPNRIVPVLRPYHGDAGSGNWTKAPGMEAYIRERLEAYDHDGIGEFHVHNIDPADRPLLAAIAAMAKERGILVHIHSGAAPVRLFYELEPAITVLWAHAGMSEPPDVVGEMLDSYASLHADLSYREWEILGADGELDPEWRAVILRHPDRLMVGSDTWVNSQWDDYDGLIATNRRWLAKLPRDIAEGIAYKNAARLFGRDVSGKLVGTR